MQPCFTPVWHRKAGVSIFSIFTDDLSLEYIECVHDVHDEMMYMYMMKCHRSLPPPPHRVLVGEGRGEVKRRIHFRLNSHLNVMIMMV